MKLVVRMLKSSMRRIDLRQALVKSTKVQRPC